MPKIQLERSILIEADPQRVYEGLADYQTWTTWSPWLIADPEATVTVSKNPAAVGSTYHWTGTITGEGELVHKVLKPGQLIEDDLSFIKPFKSFAKTAFHLRRSQTRLASVGQWTPAFPGLCSGWSPMMKTFIGMDYQRGLNMFKDWIETGANSFQSKSAWQ